MRKIKLFTALSLDNFIAKKDGGIDWLFMDADYGYTPFSQSIDTTLMGRKTYEQVLTFGDFPYPNSTNFVFTKNQNLQDNENVSFIKTDIIAFCENLKKQSGKDIWLIGGGAINSILLNHGLIDELILSIHPVYLGEGIPLFPYIKKQVDMKLIANTIFPNGLVQLTYQL